LFVYPAAKWLSKPERLLFEAAWDYYSAHANAVLRRVKKQNIDVRRKQNICVATRYSFCHQFTETKTKTNTLSRPFQSAAE
jgi:hypothetical protein